MPLSEHEQRILEEIEQRLAEDDPRLVEQVGRTDLYTHLARRIRLSALAFVLGCVLLLLFVVDRRGSPRRGSSSWSLSALLIYRYLGQLGRDQIRAMQSDGGSFTGIIGRLAARVPPAVATPTTTTRSASLRDSPFGWFRDHRDLAACHRSARCCTTVAASPWARDVGRCTWRLADPCRRQLND